MSLSTNLMLDKLEEIERLADLGLNNDDHTLSSLEQILTEVSQAFRYLKMIELDQFIARDS